MDQKQQNETQRELPSPELGVDPNHQQHCAAGLEQNRQELQKRQKDELKLREKLRDHDADHGKRAERFLYSAPASLFNWSRVFCFFRLNIHLQ